MTNITIAAGGFPHVNTNNLEPGEIWIIANKSYTTPDGKFITASTPDEGIFVARGAFTIDGSNVLQAPELVVDATVNAIDYPDATLTAYIMTTQGRPVSVLSVFRDFRLDSSPASTDWLEIATFNAGTLPADVGHDVVITGDLDVSGVTTLAHLALALGSDADGDMYVRSGGELVRVPIGAEDATLTVVGGLPAWSGGGGGGGASTLLTDLVAYWKLGEASGNRVDSAGSNDLTPSNAPGSVAGKQGNAVSLASASSQYLTIADNAALSMNGRSFTLACWVKVTTAVAFAGIVSKWQASGSAEYVLCLNAAATKYRFGVSGGSGTIQDAVESVASVAVGTWQFVVATYDNVTGAITIRVDGGTAVTGSHAGGIDTTALPFQIGAFNSTFFLNGAVDEAGIWDRVLTSSEITALYAAGSGVTHPFTGVSTGGGGGTSTTTTLASSDLHDNGYSTALSGYTRSSEFARAVFDTEATSLSIDIYSNFTATGNNIEVRVNGVFHARLAAGSGATTVTTTLPAGNKRVEIIAGEQLLSGATVTGIFLNGFTTDGAHTLVLPNPAGRLLVYGDSIASGYTSTTPVSSAWPMLIRQMRLASTAVDAWGLRDFYTEANTSLLRAALVSQLANQHPTILWISIGANDAGFGPWTPTAFGTAYAALLDDLHTALPALKIYCQSMSVATNGPNGLGFAYNDYRAPIQTAANARDWCEFVDGTTILTTSDIVDNTHPSDAGHAIYARFVANVLNLQ